MFVPVSERCWTALSNEETAQKKKIYEIKYYIFIKYMNIENNRLYLYRHNPATMLSSYF